MNNRIKYKKKKKSVVAMASLALLLTLIVGTTVAFLIAKTNSIQNDFIPAQVTCEVSESFEDNIKNNVTIKNTSNIDAYIRVSVIATWQDSNGNIYSEKPVEDTHYTMEWTGINDNSWFKAGDYYYHKAPVAENEKTSELFTKCKMINDVVPPEDGYTLHVEILCSAIQAKGQLADDTYAVEDAWTSVKVGNENGIEVLQAK